MCLPTAKAEQVTLPAASPLPSPSPVATAADTNPEQTADQKRKSIAALKYGAMSTIKSGSAKGITGSGPDLYQAQAGGKQNLGS